MPGVAGEPRAVARCPVRRVSAGDVAARRAGDAHDLDSDGDVLLSLVSRAFSDVPSGVHAA